MNNTKQKSCRQQSTGFLFGTPRGIRTPDPLVRSQILYPAELLAHISTPIYFITSDVNCQAFFYNFKFLWLLYKSKSFIPAISYQHDKNARPFGRSGSIKLIIFFAYFEIALGMCTGGAYLGSLCANNDVTTVSAFPYLYFALFKYLSCFYIL